MESSKTSRDISPLLGGLNEMAWKFTLTGCLYQPHGANAKLSALSPLYFFLLEQCWCISLFTIPLNGFLSWAVKAFVVHIFSLSFFFYQSIFLLLLLFSADLRSLTNPTMFVWSSEKSAFLLSLCNSHFIR